MIYKHTRISLVLTGASIFVRPRMYIPLRKDDDAQCRIQFIQTARNYFKGMYKEKGELRVISLYQFNFVYKSNRKEGRKNSHSCSSIMHSFRRRTTVDSGGKNRYSQKLNTMVLCLFERNARKYMDACRNKKKLERASDKYVVQGSANVLQGRCSTHSNYSS